MDNLNKNIAPTTKANQETDSSVGLICKLKQQGADETKEAMLKVVNSIKAKIEDIECRLGYNHHYDIVGELRNIRSFYCEILEGLIEQNIYFQKK